MSDDDVTTDAVDSLNASVGIDFTAPEWTQPSPALAAIAMRERAAEELDSDVADLKADASRFRQGTDPYHGRMAFAEAAKMQAERIRALPPTFTDAELLAAAMQLPEVLALVEAADAVDDEYIGLFHYNHMASMSSIEGLRSALAPFMKGAS